MARLPLLVIVLVGSMGVVATLALAERLENGPSSRPSAAAAVDAAVPKRMALPQAPRQGYVIPKVAGRVRTSAGLRRALAGPRVDIVLEDGTYEGDSPFEAAGKRLYARHVGKAVLAAGVDLGSPHRAGGQLYGVKIVVANEAQLAPLRGAVTTWGGSGAVVQDVEIDGGRVAWYGVTAAEPDGVVVERVVVRNVLSDGLRLSDNSNDSQATIRRVWDVRVSDADNPESLNGTGEACIWIGHRVAEGVRRIAGRRCGWMGLWTGNAIRDTIIQDVTISGTPVAIYPEHSTTRVVFRRLDLSASGTGFNVEWWYGGAGSGDLTVEQFRITAGRRGIFLDAGTFGTVIRNGVVVAPDGIGYPANLADPSKPNVIEQRTIDLSRVPGRKVWRHENEIG
jgi:predicted NUDIX family NTP pyrophosphohydrolase